MTKQSHKVLVVDDDVSIRESLRKLLHGEGYQVEAVANGLEAVELFCRNEQQFDLLLVDLNMPLKNGWATLDRLLEINPFLPVLIVTGQPNQYEMAAVAGVSALIEKPIDVPQLLQIIHKLLAQPIISRLQRTGHAELPLYLAGAAGHPPRYLWKDQVVTPYHHGGLNE